jgi:hypothetical protein
MIHHFVEYYSFVTFVSTKVTKNSQRAELAPSRSSTSREQHPATEELIFNALRLRIKQLL